MASDQYITDEQQTIIQLHLPDYLNEDELILLTPQLGDVPPYRKIHNVAIKDGALNFADLEEMAEFGPFILVGEVDPSEIENPNYKEEKGRVPMWTMIYEWSLEVERDRIVHWVLSAKSWWKIKSARPEYRTNYLKTIDASEPLRLFFNHTRNQQDVPEGEAAITGPDTNGVTAFTKLIQHIAGHRRKKPRAGEPFVDTVRFIRLHKEFYAAQLDNLGVEDPYMSWVLRHPNFLSDVELWIGRSGLRGRGFPHQPFEQLIFEELPVMPKGVWYCPSEACGYETFFQQSPGVDRSTWIKEHVLAHVVKHLERCDRNLMERALESWRVRTGKFQRELAAAPPVVVNFADVEGDCDNWGDEPVTPTNEASVSGVRTRSAPSDRMEGVSRGSNGEESIDALDSGAQELSGRPWVPYIPEKYGLDVPYGAEAQRFPHARLDDFPADELEPIRPSASYSGKKDPMFPVSHSPNHPENSSRGPSQAGKRTKRTPQEKRAESVVKDASSDEDPEFPAVSRKPKRARLIVLSDDDED